MLGHGAGLGYTGPGMGPIDNFSLVTGPMYRERRKSLIYSVIYQLFAMWFLVQRHNQTFQCSVDLWGYE